MLPMRKSVPRSSRQLDHTRRPLDDRKETQTAVLWSCFPFIRSSQNHLARHSEREKKTRQTVEEVGRQHQGMDRPGVRQVPEGSGEQGKMEKTGCKIICGAPTTLTIKGLIMMMRRRRRSICGGRVYMSSLSACLYFSCLFSVLLWFFSVSFFDLKKI